MVRYLIYIVMFLVSVPIYALEKSVGVAVDASAIADDETESEGEEENREDGEEDEYDELDSMLDEMDSMYGMPESEKLCDQIIEYTKSYMKSESDSTMENAMYYAMTAKMTSYHQQARFGRLIEYADSVLTSCAFNDATEYYYYYIVYLKAVGYIEQGKYKLAMQCAQELYNDGKEEPDYRNFDPDHDILPQAVRNRCNALFCMGIANREMGQYKEALNQFDECIELASHFGNPMLLVKYDTQMLRIETSLKCEEGDVVLNYMERCAAELDRIKADGDRNVVPYEASLHTMYVDVCCKMNQPEQARYHIDRVERLIEENGLPEQAVADLNRAKAIYYKSIGQNVMAVAYADSAARFYEEVSKPNYEVDMLKVKLDAVHGAKLYSQEYALAQRIISLNDSLATQKYNSQMEEMGTMMGMDKLNNEKKALTAQRQMWVMVSVLVVVLALFSVFYLNYRRSKERQKILSQQKELLEAEVTRQTAELRQQKSEIEQINRDITDSINYAERIQSKILPDLSQYKNYGIEGAFAFFIPCNIVSGDFYWATRQNGQLIIACSDCTGHGVPGAFVSMIGSTSLNEISSNASEIDPGQMLEDLDANVMKVLGQSGGEARDGMDIALVSYDPETRKMKAAGARRPVFVIRKNGELEEFKGVKRSIGETDEGSRMKPFETMEIDVEPGDTIYMCSDGLADQFGGQEIHGENGKRLMSGGLKKMLMKLNAEDIDKQRDLAEKLYWEWRGTCPQLDDISLVGIRI